MVSSPIGNASIASDQAKIPFIQNLETPRAVQRIELDMIREMNEDAAKVAHDEALEGRINSFALAFRMQMAAPERQSIADESAATLKLYGIDEPKTKNFGRQCLMARRFAER